VAALEALALNPVVIPSDCASHAAVSAEALRLAQAANDDWLFCEDDIVPHPRFHEALGLAARGKQVTYLYLHETLGMNLWYPAELQAAIAAREPITPSRVRLRDASGLCNAQCVYIPARAARQMMPTALLEWNRSFDIYLEQFLRDSANRRTDEYGGSVANRGRFLFEIVDGVTAAIGSDRVGVRLSPAGTAYCPPDSDSQALYDFVVGVLDNEHLAYLHLREADANSPDGPNAVTDVGARYRTVYHGTLLVNTGYDRATGNAAVADGTADLVAFGVPWISNPDLVQRFRRREALAEADRNTFYQGGARGYVDYPFLHAEAA